jgi:hypothetical protein
MSSVTGQVQEVLALILTSPTKRLRDAVQTACATDDDRTRSEVFSQARESMKAIASTPFRQVEGGNEPPPLLIDRLSFAWSLLKRADSLIRGTALPKPPKPVSKLQAAPNVDEFHRGLLVEELSTNLVNAPTGAALQTALFELLGVDEKGQFLLLYNTFLKANTPKKLGLNVIQADGSLSDRNARRLARWIVRKLNMKYVDFVDGALVVHVPFLMEQVCRDFYEWSGLRKDACDSGSIKDIVADEITRWLTYSCLDGDLLPESAADQTALVKVFHKDNKLNDRVHSAPPQADPIKDRRIAELEAVNAKANEDIRSLESKLAAAQPAAAPVTEEPAAGRDDATAQAIRDVCKAIESKYPLDKLSDAQHSDDPMLSLKSVLSHLFFVLRRQGLSSYPTEDVFELSYEKAGLFECLGFEVPPGESRPVEVVQRGWAIKSGDRLLPIRRAQVRTAAAQ